MANQNNRNRKPHHNSRPTGKGKDKDDRCTNGNGKREEGYAATKHKYNDVSWYAKNPEMLRDAASYSYNNPLGTNVPLNQLVSPATVDVSMSYYDYTAVPGLMTLRIMPTIGVSNSSTSPANLAAQNIYSYVRYMNSGAKNYDQADLMLYLLAMDSIYATWNFVKRAYGYARTYSQYNKYMPRVYALGDRINFDDLIQNLADYRMRLNALAARISSFCVPAVMPIFVRHSWMVSNIYKDSDNNKAQQYMFTLDGYYTYEETASQNGGTLQYHKFPSTTAKLSTYLDTITAMLDKVGYSEDIGVMSGDILKAYGQEKLFKITPVEPDFLVLPVYNEEVLNQIHNSTLISGMDTATELDVTQNPDNGWLIWKPKIAKADEGNVDFHGKLLNMPWDNVTPENTMVGTRLCATVASYSSANTYHTIGTCGSEVVVREEILQWTNEANSTANRYKLPAAFIFDKSETAGPLQNTALGLMLLSNFDWHPLVFLFSSQDGKALKALGMAGDITNYTVITTDNLQSMNETALLSEFNVPQLGSF